MTDTKVQVPQKIHGHHVLAYRQVNSEKHRLVIHNPDNKYHPFVVATWYPWNGDKEWAQGTYLETLEEAMVAYRADR